MSKIFYVVREDTRTLLDIVPNYTSEYDMNMCIREAYATIFKCHKTNVFLLYDKRTVRNYQGIL